MDADSEPSRLDSIVSKRYLILCTELRASARYNKIKSCYKIFEVLDDFSLVEILRSGGEPNALSKQAQSPGPTRVQ